jgi:hypothetical protein
MEVSPVQPESQPREQPKEGLVARAVNAVLRDGTLAAAWRQGLDEIGAALKAFPESIQVSELGTIGSPTPGEIGLQRGAFGLNQEQESRASLIDQSRAAGTPGQDQGRSQGQER